MANNIREVIKQRQAEMPGWYSPSSIARRLRVHLVTIYKWEAGTTRPTSDNLLRLARDLRVPVEALRTAPDEPVPTASVRVAEQVNP